MKIPSSQENPLDVLNIKLANSLCPFFNHLGFTANGITTLSLIFGLLSLYFLFYYNFPLFAIFYYISYFFDCMDGHYARKYKCVSKFGDYYDHIKDILVVSGLIIILIFRYKETKKTWIIASSILLLFTLLMVAHLGCQEKLYPHDESPMLEKSKVLCLGKPSKSIQVTKYFGCGTFTIILILVTFYLWKSRI